MEFSGEDLAEAKRQIDSTLHKLRETIKTFESKENAERYKSQITLAKRRVKAFEIANWLIEREMENVEEPLMREIRYLDKLVDELARGKAMDQILRK